jgi:excisionase family DNA binding protein
MINREEAADRSSNPDRYLPPTGGKLDVQAIRPQRALLKVQEVLHVLGLGRSTVYELMDSGTLESVRISKSRRIPIDAPEQFLVDLRGQGTLDCA